MAIISDVAFGLRDTNHAMLSFTVEGLWGGALLCFRGQEALDFVEQHDVIDVARLNGRPCVVKAEWGKTVTLVRLWGKGGGE